MPQCSIMSSPWNSPAPGDAFQVDVAGVVSRSCVVHGARASGEQRSDRHNSLHGEEASSGGAASGRAVDTCSGVLASLSSGTGAGRTTDSEPHAVIVASASRVLVNWSAMRLVLMG
jgi:hypothetical protein